MSQSPRSCPRASAGPLLGSNTYSTASKTQTDIEADGLKPLWSSSPLPSTHICPHLQPSPRALRPRDCLSPPPLPLSPAPLFWFHEEHGGSREGDMEGREWRRGGGCKDWAGCVWGCWEDQAQRPNGSPLCSFPWLLGSSPEAGFPLERGSCQKRRGDALEGIRHRDAEAALPGRVSLLGDVQSQGSLEREALRPACAPTL